MNADEPTSKVKEALPDVTENAAPMLPEPKATENAAKAPRQVSFRNKIIFACSILGVLAGLVGAYLFGMQRKAQPPVFAPVSNPYATAIYANGMIESDQPNGVDVNIYPQVAGPITEVLAREGQSVLAGAVLFRIDDSIQRATTEQLRLQAQAALTLLNELKAEPRLETLAVARAQVTLADSNLKQDRDQYDKDLAAYTNSPGTISKDVLDTAKDAVDQATSALGVASRQYDLTKAGAWSYDIANQQQQYDSLTQSYNSANALLQKYYVKAPMSGVVLMVNAAVGSYASSLGAYDSYTQLQDPLVIMGGGQDYLDVRCYVDEILVSRLPPVGHIQAQMSIIGTDIKVPLEFVRVQPYVSPKIELSNERQEQVDLRVLPVIFRFEKKDAPVYPGQMVDVYIGKK